MNDLSTTRLLLLLIFSLLLGCALGVTYIAVSFVRILLVPDSESKSAQTVRCVLTFFLDIAFCTFAGVCVVLLFFTACDGRVRLLGLVGCISGFLLEHLLLGRRTVRLLSRIVGGARRVIAFFWRHTFGWLGEKWIVKPIGKLRAALRAKRTDKKPKVKKENNTYSI